MFQHQPLLHVHAQGSPECGRVSSQPMMSSALSPPARSRIAPKVLWSSQGGRSALGLA